MRLSNPQIRFLKELEDVIYDRKWLKKFSKEDLEKYKVYFMYRDLAETASDYQKIKAAGLRYDITIIPPKMLGIEYPKTLGHEHSLVPGTKLAYPEIYEVLQGEAYFLQQKMDKTKNKVTEVYLIKAKKGDKVITALNCAHITINPAKKPLKMANWIYREAGSDYSVIKNKKGGAYYAVKIRGKLKWIKNNHYQEVAELKIREATSEILGLTKKQNIYSLVNNLDKLDFLKNPQNHLELLRQQ